MKMEARNKAWWYSKKKHTSTNRNTQKHEHTDPRWKCSCKDTHKTEVHSWADAAVNASQFVLEVSSEERARPSVTVCTAEGTLVLIKCTESCSLVCFTSETQTCFKPKWVRFCGKIIICLFYILLRRWRLCSCTIHPNKLVCAWSLTENDPKKSL